MTNRTFLGSLLLLLIVGPAGCDEPHTPVAAAVGAAAPKGHEDPPANGVRLCEHGVPAELCTKCAPELAEVFKEQGDWCDEHGLPESHCRQCNPGLSFDKPVIAREPWCREHGLPEAKCTKCKPQLVPRFIAAGDFCREHGFPESACPRCHPELAEEAGQRAAEFPPDDLRVRLANEDLADKAGIETRRAEVKPFAQTLDVVGQLQFDQNKSAQITSRGEAVVLEVRADVGDRVRPGQPLVVLASASVGESQARVGSSRARLEAARSAFAREDSLFKKGVSSKRALDEARTELAAAEGEHAAAVSGLRATGAGAGGGGRYVLTAPIAGTVVARDALAGRTVSGEHVLLEIADVRSMWAILDVPEENAALVRPGQRVALRIDGHRVERPATVSRVGASVDRATRSVRVRVDLPNPDGALKAGQFLRASIDVSGESAALFIPRDAIQRAEDRDLVFLVESKGVYRPVAVEVGQPRGEEVAVVSGLEPGAEYVSGGAFLLKTEILKDSIGAGCADD